MSRSIWVLSTFLCMCMTAEALKLTPDGYDHHLRPPGPNGGPIVVQLSMRINSINEVNEKEMSIALEVYFRATWHDPRLDIPVDLFEEDGPDTIPLNSEIFEDTDLWLPDPVIDRVRWIHTAELIQPFRGVRLSRDGTLLWGQMFIINLRCAMSFDNFPFDKQTCHVDIESYFHNNEDMIFGWDGDGISASEDIPKVLNNYAFTFKQENVTSCHTPGYINGRYPCLKSVMTFTRRYRSYLMGVYFPSLIFVVVAWASFFWPAEAIPARTVLLITALLATISLYTGVQQITPPTNYTRAIDNWFFACIVAIASALFQYAIILQIRKMQDPYTNVKPLNTEVRTETREESSDGKDGECCNKIDEILEKVCVTGKAWCCREKDPEYWHRVEDKVEKGARILYLIFFTLFNLVYWISYL